MTPEERSQSVLYFLEGYLAARDEAKDSEYRADYERLEIAKAFLGTALVALVTDARKVDE